MVGGQSSANMPASRTKQQPNTAVTSLLLTICVSVLISVPTVRALPQISLPGQNIRDIFLTGGTSARFGGGGGGGGGYSGDSSASLDPSADILVEIVKGAASLTGDYNTAQLSEAQVEESHSVLTDIDGQRSGVQQKVQKGEQ